MLLLTPLQYGIIVYFNSHALLHQEEKLSSYKISYTTMAKLSKIVLLFSILLSAVFADESDDHEDKIRPFPPIPIKPTCTTLPVTISCGSMIPSLPSLFLH
jgi:hypothetical protein